MESKRFNFALFFWPAVIILLHLYTNYFASYGIFRDEFYYIACSKRPDIGYVDQPPLSIWVLSAVRFLFGESLFALRLLPALVSGIVVFLTGMLTKKMGGGNFAVFLAGLALVSCGIFLGIFTIYSMNYLDYLFWISAAYFIVLISENPQPKYWIYLGLILGFGLLNKISVLWLGAGIFAGIVFTPLRSSLKTRWPYITAIIAFALFLPYIIWNFTHDFAHIQFIQNATKYKYNGITRTDFIMDMIMSNDPFNLFIWIPGLYFFFFNKEGRKYIIPGIIFITVFLILFINGKSKSEYVSLAFPFLFAGGAVMWEKIILKKGFALAKYVVPGIIFIGLLISVPFGLPILPVDSFISYSKAIGIGPANSESKELGDLPQFYADMFGWEEMAAGVSKVYVSLPDSLKKKTIIFAGNYGEAGALEYYSKKYPLPVVVCPHNSYWYWGGKHINDSSNAIVLGGTVEDHNDCNVVIKAAVLKAKHNMPYENNLPVYICRDFKFPAKVIWQKSRFFI